MSIPATQEILKACNILFGSDIEFSLEFLYYIQLSGIKSAYRKRARETHPDLNEEARCDAPDPMDHTGKFVEANWAYERLNDFVGVRDTQHARRTYHARMQHPSPPKYTHQRQKVKKWAKHKVKTPELFHKGIMPERRLMFGEYLFYTKQVSWEDIVRALVWQRGQRPKFGRIAQDRGLLHRRELLSAIRERRVGEPIGQTLIRLGVMKASEVDGIVEQQSLMHKPIGMYFLSKGLFDEGKLTELLVTFHQHNSEFSQTQ